MAKNDISNKTHKMVTRLTTFFGSQRESTRFSFGCMVICGLDERSWLSWIDIVRGRYNRYQEKKTHRNLVNIAFTARINRSNTTTLLIFLLEWLITVWRVWVLCWLINVLWSRWWNAVLSSLLISFIKLYFQSNLKKINRFFTLLIVPFK